MQIRAVPYQLVAADNAVVKKIQGSSHPSWRSQRFCTAHHNREEIITVVPETPTFTHAYPPWTPYGYAIWHNLIAQSQQMTEHHIFTIPSFLYEDFMRGHAAWMTSGQFSETFLEETIESWKSTTSGKQLAPLLDGTKKWFIRLDQMSPKDSPFGGNLPSSTFEDVIMKICSSMRAYGCLQHAKEDADKGDQRAVMQLILNPWNADMDPAREFRIFVPPPAAHGINEPHLYDFKISGISQYRWHCVFEPPFGLTVKEVAEKVCEGARSVLADLIDFTTARLGADTRNMLLKYGFSFDVALQQDGSVQLVEINPFGAMSGCGACLFNWVLDGITLYGLEEEVTFVVTLEDRA
jgi:hypothetical protein